MSSSKPEGTGALIERILIFIVLLAPIFAAVFLARWNWVHGKGDRRGAMVLSTLIFSLHLLLWAFQAHLASLLYFLYLLALAISTGLFLGGMVWVLYLALEPYVRRYWPQAIISWTRLLAGRWRDPLVGRDVLYGVVLGVFFCDVYGVYFYLTGRLGAPPAILGVGYLGSTRIAIAAWLQHIPESILSTLLVFLVLFLLRVLLRKGWLGAVAFVLLFAALKSVSSDYPAVSWPIQAILYAALGAGALRYGLVMLTVALYTADLTLNIPATLNPSAWYFSTAMVVLATLVALAIWGFYTALAGQTPWKAEAQA